MKKTLFIVSLFLSIISAKGQTWLWGVRGIPTNTNSCLAIAADEKGNVFLTGSFTVSIFIGNRTLTAPVGDCYLVKYDSLGNTLWVAQPVTVTGTDFAAIVALSTDRSGNIFATGNVADTVSFGVYKIISPPTMQENGSIFLAKYDANGNVLWAKQSTFPSKYAGALAYSDATDETGNCFITGDFMDTICFGSDTLISHADTADINDLFLAKYNANGNILWTRQAINLHKYSISEGISVATDAKGNCYVTGFYSDSVSFGADTLTGNINSDNIFVTKYDSNGNVLWAKQAIGSTLGNEPSSITTNAKGDSYLIGSIVAGATLIFGTDTLHNTINDDIFVAKYATNGNVLWVKQGNILSGTCISEQITTDTVNHIYLTDWGAGQFIYGNDTITFPGNLSTTASVIMQIDTLGNLLCYSTLATNTVMSDVVAVTPSGSCVYDGGNFYGTLIFGKDTLDGDSVGINPFLARWQPCYQVPKDEGINKLRTKSEEVSIYPNPNNGKFTVVLVSHSELVSESHINIEIYNMLGEKIYFKTLQNLNGAQINLSSQPDGIYLYRVITSTDKLLGSGKFVIER